MASAHENVSEATDLQALHAEANRALSMILKGQSDAGIAAYAALLRDEDFNIRPLPLGLHLQMLRRADHLDAAAEIQRLALRKGADPTLSALRQRSVPEAIAEYRGFISAGQVNGLMVSRYLLLLEQQGERAAMRPYLDVDRLVSRQTVLRENAGLLSEAAELFRAEAMASPRREKDQSLRNLDRIAALHRRSEPVIVELLARAKEAIDGYLAERADELRQLFSWTVEQYRLRAFAVLSEGEGFNVPHVHSPSLITAVLYLAGPADAGGPHSPGALRVTGPSNALDPSNWPDLSFAPTPGTMVLMPSWMTHWTVPLDRPVSRISVAFDVVK